MSKEDKEGIILIVGILLYFLCGMATGIYYHKRQALNPQMQPAAIMIGVGWPVYWTARALDAIIDPVPLPAKDTPLEES